jgi:hypothetical protein
MLARQEIQLLIGDASPDQARQRVMRIAQTGSRDATAVLFSDFGRSMLETRGLQGRDLEETLTAGRGLAAVSAPERKGSTTEEIAASRAYSSVEKLAAAITAADLYVRHATGQVRA